ncbi:MAG: hypothetical protein LBP24_01875, partial [Coriobacteriales bacterium]|nr:hypothetical protein [Coriobacteriales bacterium]
MLDTKFVRENTEAVNTAMKNRNYGWDSEGFLALETRRRAVIADLESLQARRNTLSRDIGVLMRAAAGAAKGQGGAGAADAAASSDAAAADAADALKQVDEAKAEVRDLNVQIEGLEQQKTAAEEALAEVVMALPNIPSEFTPLGADENDNVEVRRWGVPREFDFEPQAHWDIGPALGIIDFERAVKLAKSRFV